MQKKQVGFLLQFAGFLWFLALSNGLYAQTTYYSRAPGGNWNSSSTWSTVAYDNATNAGTFPVAGDIVFIGGTGSTVTIGVAAACATLTIEDNGTLTVNQTIDVSGATTVGGGSSGTLTINNMAGSKTFGGLVTINSGGLWNETVAEAIVFQGGITNNGTFTANTATHSFNTNSQALTGALVIPFVNVPAGIILTNNTSLTVSTTLNGAGEIVQGTNALLSIGGTLAGATDLTATASGNTVNFSGGDQAVRNTAYFNLTLSGSGNKTAGGAPTIAGNLVVEDNVNLILNASITVTGTTTVGGGTSGTLTVNNTAGTKTFGGLVTINSGGLWDETVNEAVTFQGGITNNGTFTAGTAIHTFNTNSQALTGTLSIPSVTVTGVTLTNNTSLTVSTALSGTGGITQGTNAVLNIGGTSAITTLTATASGNTVNYSGAAQTVKDNNYHHLTLSGSGVKTLQAGTTSIGGDLTLSGTVSTTAVVGLTIGGAVTIGGGTSLTSGALTHAIAGDWTNNGTFTGAGSQINLNGGSQNIGGGATTFDNLRLSGTGTKTFNVSTTISSELSIDNGAVAGLDNANTHTSNSLLLGGVPQGGSWGSTASAATNQDDFYFSGTGILNVATSGSTYYSIASTDWSLNTTWSTVGFGGPAAADTPGAGDNVIIGDGFTVTVTGNEACETLVFDAGTSITNTLSITTGSVAVTGAVTIPQTVTSGSNILSVGAGSLTAASLDFTASGSGAGHQLTISTGTATISGNITGIGASSTISFTGAGLLRVSGSMFTAANGTLNAPSGTVEYNGAAQTVQALPYFNLALSGSGNKTLSTATDVTISGNLVVGDNTNFLIGGVGGFALVVVGSTTVGGGTSGTLTINNTAGTKTFSGLVTVNSGGLWDETVGEALTFQGGITNNGTFTANTGVHTFNTNSQALTGTFVIPSVTVAGGAIVLTNNTSLTVNTALSGTGRITQGTNAVLNIGGTSGITNMTATASGNTVNYTGAAQTVHNNNYHHLTLSGSGVKTLQAGTTSLGGDLSLSGTVSTTAVVGLTIGGAVTIDAGTSLTAGAFTHNVAGDWTNNGTFTGTGSQINFNGGSQNIGGGSTTFDNLRLSGTGTKTFNVSTTISNELSIDNGAVAGLDNANTYTSNTLLLGGAQQGAGSWGSTASAATNQNDFYFSGTGVLNVALGGVTYYSIASDDWNQNTTWSTVGFGGPAAGDTPGAGDFVFIGDGFTVTVTGNETCDELLFDAGTSVTNTLSITTGNLAVTGAVTIPQTVTSGSNILSVGAGSLTAASLDFTASGSGAGHQLTISTGTATISGNITGIGASSTISFTGAGLLRVSGSMFTAANGTLNAPSGTVEYNGAAQTVQALPYFNLATSGSGNKSLAGTTTIGGNLIIGDNTNFIVGASTLVVTGTTTVGGGASGTLTINSTTGTKTFSGLVTINSGGLWNETVNEAIIFQGGITNNGTFTAGTAVHTFNTNSQALTGTFIIPSVTVTGGAIVLTNNTSLTVNTALSGTGRITQGANAVLNIGGTSGITNMTATASGNTVNYTGAAQTVHSNNYHHLTLSGSGVKTLQVGTTSIAGDLTLSGTASATAVVGLTIGGAVSIGAGTSLTAGAFTHNVAGDWTNNGGTFVETGSTIVLNGVGQTIGGSVSTPFNNLSFTGSGTKVLGVSTAMSGMFSIATGVVADLTSFITHTAQRLELGGALQVSGTWGGTGSGATNINTVFFAANPGIITIALGDYTYYSRASITGDWNDPASWSTVGHGSTQNDGTFPTATSYAVIGGNSTVTVTADAFCTDLAFDAGTSVTNTLTINVGNTLTVSGDVTIPQTITSGANIMDVGSGSLVAGSISFTAGSPGGTGHRMTISTGTATVSGNVTGTGTSSSIIFSGNGLLQLGGSFYSAANGTLTTVAGSTVEYNGAAQTVQSFTTYNNLRLSGSGTKTLSTATNTTLNGNLIVGDNTTFVVGALTLFVNGTTTVGGGTSGTLSVTSTTGTKTFVGLVTIASGATWNEAVNETFVFRGGITNNGTFTAGTGNHTFNTNSQALTGTFVFSTITVTGAAIVLTNNTSLTVNTALNGTGRITQGTNAVLNIGGTSAIANMTATASGNTVNYTGAAQTVNNNNYHHLTLSGSGVKTMQAGTTSIGGDFVLSGTVSVSAVTGLGVAGSLEIGTGTSFAAGAFTHSIGGDWKNDGTFTGTGTIRLNGLNDQDLTGTSITTFNNLDVTNSSGTVTILSSQRITNHLSLGPNTTFITGDALTLVSSSDTQSASIGEIGPGAFFGGDVTVQRFMGAEGSFNRYVSSPVTGATLAELANTFALVRDLGQAYDEPLPGSYMASYVNVPLSTTLVSGKGYLVYPTPAFANSDIVWDVTGPLTGGFNQGDVDLNVTYTDNGDVNADGWNLVGNPYPSAIVWDGNLTNWDIQDVEPIVYVPDIANPAYFMSYDYTTGLGVPGLGTLAGGVIALGQAFWVKAEGPSLSPLLLVRESAKTSASGEFYRMASKPVNGLAVVILDQIGRDGSWLVINPESSQGYDRKFDRSKLESPALAISFLVEGRKLVNSTIPTWTSEPIPMSVYAGSAGQYSITFEQIGSLPEFNELYLADKLLGNSHRISAGDYIFEVPEKGDIPDRFYLYKEAGYEAQVSMYPNPVTDKLTINVSTQEEARATVKDMSGRSIMTGSLIQSGFGTQSIEFDFSTLANGFYFVEARYGGKSVIRKIIKK